VDYGLATNNLKTLVCPSAAVDPNLVTVGVINFVLYQINGADSFSYGEFVQPFLDGRPAAPGLTNYLGVCGARGNNTPYPDAIWYKFAGLFDNRTNLSLGLQVSDGTSNTLLVGEACGTLKNGVVAEGIAWMGVGVQANCWGLGGPEEATSAQFSSRHIGVVNFCYADRSAHTFKRVVVPEALNSVVGLAPPVALPDPNAFREWYMLQQLAGYKDGQFPEQSYLVN
jgi:hypothetical protein